MIDVKEAVKAAYDFAHNLPNVGLEDPFTLEEVELTNDDQYWLITLGFYRAVLPSTTSPMGAFSEVLAKRERAYKTMKIHANTGEVRSMKIRDV